MLQTGVPDPQNRSQQGGLIAVTDRNWPAHATGKAQLNAFFGQNTPAIVISLHNESIWHENESRRKNVERFTKVHNYPFATCA